MSERTCYQRNSDMTINRAKDYWENMEKRRYDNMFEEKKQRLKEYQKNYREAKKFSVIINKIFFL